MIGRLKKTVLYFMSVGFFVVVDAKDQCVLNWTIVS